MSNHPDYAKNRRAPWSLASRSLAAVALATLFVSAGAAQDADTILSIDKALARLITTARDEGVDLVVHGVAAGVAADIELTGTDCIANANVIAEALGLDVIRHDGVVHLLPKRQTKDETSTQATQTHLAWRLMGGLAALSHQISDSDLHVVAVDMPMQDLLISVANVARINFMGKIRDMAQVGPVSAHLDSRRIDDIIEALLFGSELVAFRDDANIVRIATQADPEWRWLTNQRARGVKVISRSGVSLRTAILDRLTPAPSEDPLDTDRFAKQIAPAAFVDQKVAFIAESLAKSAGEEITFDDELADLVLTLRVDEPAPLIDVLFMLSQLAGARLEIEDKSAFRLRAKPKGPTVTVEFHNAPLRDVVRMIGKLSGIEVSTLPNSAAASEKVMWTVRNASWLSSIGTLLKCCGLTGRLENERKFVIIDEDDESWRSTACRVWPELYCQPQLAAPEGEPQSPGGADRRVPTKTPDSSASKSIEVLGIVIGSNDRNATKRARVFFRRKVQVIVCDPEIMVDIGEDGDARLTGIFEREVEIRDKSGKRRLSIPFIE